MEPIFNVPEDVSPTAIPSEVSDENDIATIQMKMKLFICNHWRGLISFLLPLVLIPVHFTIPTEKYQWCAYTLVLMALFWVTECIPLPVTSIMPIIIFPMSGVMNTTTICKCYINDTIVMFLGSMFLAYAVEQSGLHKRLALCAIRTIGYSHYKLLFAMSFITMFISMWITNTAAATMMVPINFALLQVFEEQNILKIYEIGPDGENIASDITTCYFCASSFSATIGGIGTLVGTATNLVFKGLFNKMYPDAPEYLSFPKFSGFAIPLMLILEILMYLNMVIIYFGFLRPNSAASKNSKMTPDGVEAAKKSVDEEWRKLGRINFWEIMVIILFSLAIILFFSRSPEIFPGWGDKIIQSFQLADRKFVLDSSAATMVCFLMLVIPSTTEFIEHFKPKESMNQPTRPIPSVLNWKLMDETMPYSFMFLLGGGFALSEAAKKEYSDLNGKIGQILKHLSYLPNYVIILLIIIFTTFVTNFASNVAVCNVITPVAMQLKDVEIVSAKNSRADAAYDFSMRRFSTAVTLFTSLFIIFNAKEIGVNPLWYNITVGFTSSFCFILPVGTPGNLVVQSAANIPTLKMIKAGLAPSLATIIVAWIFICFWAPIIWPHLHILPPWL